MIHSHPIPALRRLRRKGVINQVTGSLLILVIFIFVTSRSMAADPPANFVLHLFTDACLPNTGNPEGVRVFAEKHHLTPISERKWLDMFVGPGDGAAWLLSAQDYKFALSIRGRSHACAVWAPKANPEDVESGFRSLVSSVGKAVNAEPQVIKEETSPTPAGQAHTLILGVTRPGAKGELLFTLLAAENPNQAFQVSLQEALAENHQ